MGLEVILAAFLPVLADGFRTGFRWLFGGNPAMPINVDERVKLMDAEVRKLEAVAKLDAPLGNVSWYIADLRAGFRYVAAGIIILSAFSLLGLAGAGLIVVPDPIQNAFLELLATVFAFLFGDRMYLHLKGANRD